jgi:uncharacterized protein YbjT (DUF2867 family)
MAGSRPAHASGLEHGTRRTALVAGATGLVGGELVRQLATHPAYATVQMLTRRVPDTLLPGVEPLVVDFERPDAYADQLTADDVFCALGTTMRKAGSRAAFRRVDHDYVLDIARLARARGARHFLLVSSLGANPASRVFYSRVKGEVEAAVQELGYPSLTIVRPSVLLGTRAEFRLGEALVKPFGILMPRRYRPVHASAVAAQMIAAATRPVAGVRIIESQEIHA